MKKLIIIFAMLLIPMVSHAREISFDAGGIFNKQYIGTLEFFSVPEDKAGVAMAVHLGIFPIKNYDADISGGIDMKFYLSEEAVISKDYTDKYSYYKPIVSTRITGSIGIMTSCDYNNEDSFKYGMWFKIGMGYKVIFKKFNWFGNYAFIEPGLNVFIGTDKLIPALSNIPTQGFPRLYLNFGVGV